MDYKQIQDLIKLVNRTNLAELSIEQDDFKIKLRTKEGIAAKNPPVQGTTVVSAPVQAGPAVVPAAAPAATEAATAKPASNEPAAAPASDDDKYLTIKSPIVGTFYRKPSPDKELFVKVGDKISEGTVLCVIEAMKLFNEIPSEISGTIVKVLAEDASPVEYDQPLFLVDPN